MKTQASSLLSIAPPLGKYNWEPAAKRVVQLSVVHNHFCARLAPLISKNEQEK